MKGIPEITNDENHSLDDPEDTRQKRRSVPRQQVPTRRIMIEDTSVGSKSTPPSPLANIKLIWYRDPVFLEILQYGRPIPSEYPLRGAVARTPPQGREPKEYACCNSVGCLRTGLTSSVLDIVD